MPAVSARTIAPAAAEAASAPAAPARARRPRKAAAPAPAAPAPDAVAARAYELWLAGHGDELANWLQAERELIATA